MKVAIHQPQYMPWTGYFHKMAGADLFVFLDDVQFKKNEWQHRNRIRNADGWQWLSVPNSYKHPRAIAEVPVRNDTNWCQKHLQSLKMSYGKAPFFGEYLGRFESYYSETRDTIDKVNIGSVKLLAGIMGIATPTEVSSQFSFEGVSTERLVNICRHFGADTYIAGAGGRDYMDLSLFDAAGITVEFQEFSTPVYKQHWCKAPEDFVPGLSAIDLVFNCGPESYGVVMGSSALTPCPPLPFTGEGES